MFHFLIGPIHISVVLPECGDYQKLTCFSLSQLTVDDTDIIVVSILIYQFTAFMHWFNNMSHFHIRPSPVLPNPGTNIMWHHPQSKQTTWSDHWSDHRSDAAEPWESMGHLIAGKYLSNQISITTKLTHLLCQCYLYNHNALFHHQWSNVITINVTCKTSPAALHWFE